VNKVSPISRNTASRFLTTLAAAALLLLAYAPLPAQDTGRVALTILHYNDFHSQNLPFTVTKTMDDGSRNAVEVGGAAVLKAYVDRYRSEKPNAMLLHAGDDLQGSPVCAITKGRSQFDILELIQPDVMTLGNHEFDYGAARLRELLPLATFPVISASLFDNSIGAPFVPRYRILQRGGLTIGVFGLAPPDLARLTLRENVQGLDVLDAEKTTRQMVNDLKRQFHADLIVALSHMGVENDTALARRVSGVDVIVGGHSHTALFKPLRIGGTVVVQAGSRGRWLGVLDLTWDRGARKVVSSYGRLVETLANDVTPDPLMEERVRELEASVDAGLSEVIGTLETDWRRSHGPRESNIGSWQADAMRAHAKTDIAFQNSGGIRKDLDAGPVRMRDLWEISPFGNELVVFEVTGAQLLSMMAFQGLKEREFCQVSGLRYKYDRNKAPAEALALTVGGAAVDFGRKYSIVTNNYVGGHLHDVFNLPEAEIQVQTLMPPVSDRDVFIEAVRKQGKIRSATDGRISVIGGDVK